MRGSAHRPCRAEGVAVRRNVPPVVAIVVVLVSLLAGCDWTMAGQGPSRAGFTLLESGLNPTNVGGLSELWNAQMPLAIPGFDASPQGAVPAVSRGVVYLTYNRHNAENDQGRLYAFDAAGHTNCTTATPRSCDPLWSAVIQTNTASSPAVSNDTVFVTAPDFAQPSALGALYAFDARGTTNCSGSPKMCTPLWTARVSGSSAFAPGAAPVVAYGHVYVAMGDGIEVFDAAGQQGCSGTPKVCAPLFTIGGNSDDFAIANNKVYVGGGDDPIWLAFDANGQQGCPGGSQPCTPLFDGVGNCGLSFNSCTGSNVVVVGNKVFMGTSGRDEASNFTGTLEAFDANGVQNCHTPGSFAPVGCDPLWSTNTAHNGYDHVSASSSTVYVNDTKLNFPLSQTSIDAFDVNGVTGCTTNAGQTTCSPVRTYAGQGPVTVTDSLLVADEAGQVAAIPITGTGGASVSVANAVGHVFQLPLVAGRIYVPAKGELHVFGLP